MGKKAHHSRAGRSVILVTVAALLLSAAGCDQAHSLSDLNASRELGRSLPKAFHRPDSLRVVASQKLDGDMHGSNDVALKFSAAADDVTAIREAVVTYFQSEHKAVPQDHFELDQTTPAQSVGHYPGDTDYKPDWWTPEKLPDAQVIRAKERGVEWLYVFSKSTGTIYYHLKSW